MSLEHLVRVGRRWLNPRYLIQIEDQSHRLPVVNGDVMIVTMERGDPIVLYGADATTLRSLLGEASGEPAPGSPDGGEADRSEAPHEAAGHTGSGTGLGELVDRPEIGLREITE